MDRYLRIHHQNKRVRKKLKNTGKSGARDQLSSDRLHQHINNNLIALGKLYLEAAAHETANIRKLQHYSERTFQIMAMVYQRKPSPDALSAIRQINEVQRTYLYRMALVSWQRAKAAAEASKSEEASEHYFRATQRYLQCMARWGESDKKSYVDEFRKLKQEIATWKAQSQQKRNADEET